MTATIYQFNVSPLSASRTDAQVKRRAKPAGISGSPSGWLTGHCFRSTQGWSALRREAATVICTAERTGKLSRNLVEILVGARVGTPTLSVKDPLELAVGLLAPGSVDWRDVAPLPELGLSLAEEIEQIEGPEMFAVLWPSRTLVSRDQVKRWACDDLANEEGRRPRLGHTALSGLQAAAIVHYYGNVTLAMIEGVTLPTYEPHAELKGVTMVPAWDEAG